LIVAQVEIREVVDRKNKLNSIVHNSRIVGNTDLFPTVEKRGHFNVLHIQ
jgi:hypothetical protein